MSETYALTQRSSPLILSQPHVGLDIPPEILSRLTDEGKLKADTDWHIDRLYEDIANTLDATVLTATHSRYVIDLNRDPSGASLYPGQSVTELCPTSLFNDAPLYKDNKTPDDAEIENRRTTYWQPYHDALESEIKRIREIHGFTLLFDCHSIRSVLPRFFEGRLPTLNLGTGNGAATVPELENHLEQIAVASPYSHALNGRFKGGYITRHYGDPGNNIHAVQLELAQEDYMDEIPPFSYRQEKAQQLQPTLKKLLQAMLDWAGKTYGRNEGTSK
ncbi:N-formylglutamate deformylase [Sneathiella marina]|uniref:N-formylglutamate deformylase n=1 Tax=Sneathiella marina TaxID=2950108 RepID=A0ABY4W734_9PROT|nr:N-formylglutamate deformylase [Sneathiella marina]USG62982.1 N-formylglutamate deformylase [Sneathiella marina]